MVFRASFFFNFIKNIHFFIFDGYISNIKTLKILKNANYFSIISTLIVVLHNTFEKTFSNIVFIIDYFHSRVFQYNTKHVELHYVN